MFNIDERRPGKLSVEREEVRQGLILTSERKKLDGKKPYQLVKVPTTDLHVALVIIQALGELLCVHVTVTGTPHRGILIVCVVLGVSGGGVGLIGLGLGGGGGTSTTEETADGVTDGRTNRDTAVNFNCQRTTLA